MESDANRDWCRRYCSLCKHGWLLEDALLSLPRPMFMLALMPKVKLASTNSNVVKGGGVVVLHFTVAGKQLRRRLINGAVVEPI